MATCRTPGCDRDAVAKGRCLMHYKQARKGTLQIGVPEVGAPSGHGQYGILDADDTTVLCHECGKRFRSVASHIRTHEMTAAEYKRRHGLPRTTALMSGAVRQIHSEGAKTRVGSEAWQRLEAKRDPTMASHSRDPDTFLLRGADRARQSETAAKTARKITPRPARVQTCTSCGKEFQQAKSAKTCGAELCILVSQYEAQPTYQTMEGRARMHEEDGMNFSEIARAQGVSPQAVRIGYRGWQRYRQWKSSIQE